MPIDSDMAKTRKSKAGRGFADQTGEFTHFKKLIEALKTIRDFELPDKDTTRSLRTNASQIDEILKELHWGRERIIEIELILDSILVPEHVFHLSDPETVAEVIAYKLEQQQKEPLATIPPFYGSGVYALYYHGGLPAYEAIIDTDYPIYVGSSIPEIANAPTPKTQGTKLHGRIAEHLSLSINKSHNLSPEEFTCRYLVVQSGFEKAAEEFLIKKYDPPWNSRRICAGIGKHGDRNRKERSNWDVFHSGRGWAEDQESKSKKTPEMVADAIISHFRDLLSNNRPRWERIFNSAWVKKQVK